VLSYPHSKKAFPSVQTEPLVFQFVPIVSCPVTGHHWVEPGSTIFAPSLQVCLHMDEVHAPCLPEPSLLQAGQSQVSQPFLTGDSLQSLNRLGGPLQGGLSPVPPDLSCTGKPRTGHSAPGGASPALSREEG